jgi:hypothetical protein
MSTTARRIDNPQLNLFGEGHESTPAPGSMDFNSRIRAVLKESIKQSPLSRCHLAAEMSDLSGRDISKMMMDSWTSPSHEQHRFPCELVPSFCIAAKDVRLVELLCEAIGGHFVPGREIVDLQLGRLAAQERRLREQKKRLLKSIGG